MGHMDYQSEVKERCGKALLVKMSEIKHINPQQAAFIESAYRRGYYQGFFAALDALTSGVSSRRVINHLHNQLYKWRYSKHNGTFNQPPVIEDEL